MKKKMVFMSVCVMLVMTIMSSSFSASAWTNTSCNNNYNDSSYHAHNVTLSHNGTSYNLGTNRHRRIGTTGRRLATDHSLYRKSGTKSAAYRLSVSGEMSGLSYVRVRTVCKNFNTGVDLSSQTLNFPNPKSQTFYGWELKNTVQISNISNIEHRYKLFTTADYGGSTALSEYYVSGSVGKTNIISA